MANNALRFNSTKQFWKDGNREENGMNIGQVLDAFSKLQGVACDGAINGVKLDADPDNPSLRVILATGDTGSVLQFVDCYGTVVASFTGTLASASLSPSPSPSPSASPSATFSPSSSASRSSSASVSPSSSASSSSSASVSPSASTSPSASVSPSGSVSPSSSNSPSPSA